MVSPDDINAFLFTFKEGIPKSGLLVVDREKNRNALIELGFTEDDRIDTILNLTHEDYCEGPLPDKDRKGEVWLFGKQVDDWFIYIKLKFAEYLPCDSITKVKQSICISFHKARGHLNFPYNSK
jgi:hypothetical protein